MRLIWFTPGFAAHESDTDAVPYLQKLALAISESADLHIIALEYPFSEKPYNWNGIPVYPCNGQNKRWLKWRTAIRAWKYSTHLCQGQPELVFQSFWLGWAAVLAERIGILLKKTPPPFGYWFIGYWLINRFHPPPSTLYPPPSTLHHFCTLMGQDVLPSNERRLQQLGKAMQERLIVLSDFQQNALEQTTGFRAPKTIPFGIDAHEIPDGFHQERSTDILGVGSLHALKNWDMWLRTVAGAAAEKPDIQAILIGKGSQKNRLEALAQQLGIADRVVIRSDLSRPEVLEYMRRSKVMLHTSDFEGCGYVLIEAAAQGCRVVSTPVGVAPKMAACGDNIGVLIQKTKAALQLPEPNEPFVPYKMEDTAKEYLAWYQKNIVYLRR